MFTSIPYWHVHIWINWALEGIIFYSDLEYPGVKYYDHIIILMFDHLADQMDMVTKVTAGQLQLCSWYCVAVLQHSWYHESRPRTYWWVFRPTHARTIRCASQATLCTHTDVMLCCSTVSDPRRVIHSCWMLAFLDQSVSVSHCW